VPEIPCGVDQRAPPKGGGAQKVCFFFFCFLFFFLLFFFFLKTGGGGPPPLSQMELLGVRLFLTNWGSPLCDGPVAFATFVVFHSPRPGPEGFFCAGGRSPLARQDFSTAAGVLSPPWRPVT